eukprot:3549903-Rhodomonas_salina.3
MAYHIVLCAYSGTAIIAYAATTLRAGYAMSGTDIAHCLDAAVHATPDTAILYCHIVLPYCTAILYCLRACYALPGSDSGYGATRCYMTIRTSASSSSPSV